MLKSYVGKFGRDVAVTNLRTWWGILYRSCKHEWILFQMTLPPSHRKREISIYEIRKKLLERVLFSFVRTAEHCTILISRITDNVIRIGFSEMRVGYCESSRPIVMRPLICYRFHWKAIPTTHVSLGSLRTLKYHNDQRP